VTVAAECVLPATSVSKRTRAGADQAFLQRQRLDKGRHRLRHDRVVGRPWRGRHALVPDLAKTVALPADQMKRGVGGARGEERGDGEAGRGDQGGKRTHGGAPLNDGRVSFSADGLRRSGAGRARGHRVSVRRARGGSMRSRVRKAKRAHQTLREQEIVDTAQARLCHLRLLLPAANYQNISVVYIENATFDGNYIARPFNL
jgi:hypothetical protein